jgi:glycosyltransferase involved in cell wall biosynthesis
LRGQVAIFPSFSNVAPALASREYVDGKPMVVYAGGLHKWQQVPKMIDAISRTASICAHRFYCPDPDAVRAMLPEAVRAQVLVDRKAHEELMGLYAECHYGFILRSDIVVNHVACPTKLIEYLGMGIVPIVDCEEIGDFRVMGMQFVTLNDLLQGNLPDEARRSEMAQHNFAIYEHLREVCKQGARDIYSLLAGNPQQRRSIRPTLLTGVKGLLPPDTRRGRIARSLWRSLKVLASYAEACVSAPVPSLANCDVRMDVSILPECDLLVQVDKFEAGGLENIVLDLNDALIGAGYRVVLLVLGKVGVAVQRARERGMTVAIGAPEAEAYRALIERLKPRIVLAHYSFYGAELCHERGIPFVQVIQNTYVWFDDRQRAAFGHAAQMTTAFIALSEYAKKYSVRRLDINERRCIVLPCGIDCASLDALDVLEARRERRTKHGIAEQDFVFLSVGSINRQKNHIATVRAFATVSEELQHAKLVILGPVYEKDLLEEIEHFIEKRALSKLVIYAGATSGAQKYYAMADAFVSASLFEGGPLNLLEALKVNLPVITTNVGLAIHFRGVQGIQIVEPPVDIAEFDGTTWQLASTPAFEKRLAAAMVRTYRSPRRPDLPPEVIDAFDKSNAYQYYVELIEDLLQGKNVSGKTFSSTWPNRLAAASSEHAGAAA